MFGLMKRRSKRYSAIIAGALLVSVVAALSVIVLTGQTTPPEPEPLELTSIPSEEYGRVGIVALYKPAADVQPRINQDHARELAVDAIPGDSPLPTAEEVALARLVRPSLTERLAWVVSFDPNGWIMAPSDIPADLLVVFIDPETGKAFDIAAAGRRPDTPPLQEPPRTPSPEDPRPELPSHLNP